MAASAPRFSKPPAIRQLPDDPTRLFLECQVQGTLKPEVTWFHNNNKLGNLPNKYKQTVQAAIGNNYDIALEISNLAASDTGTYKIVAKNKAGEITASLNIDLATEDENESKSSAEK